MLAERVNDSSFHREGGEDRLDQHGRRDRATAEAELILGERDHVMPEACLEMRLQLRQVEVRPAARVKLRRGPAVEGVEAEVEQTGAERRAVEHGVLLDEVPAARADERASPCTSFSEYFFAPVSSEIVRATASTRLPWPSTTFCHVGRVRVLEVA